MQDLGTLPGDTYSATESLNDKGQVPGVSYTDVSSRAFLWQDGLMTDLNTLVCPGSGLYLANALGINSQGDIVGDAITNSGEVHGYLATPTDDGCHGEAASSEEQLGSSRSATPVLPENVRNLLRKRVGRRYHFPGGAFVPRN